MPEKSAKDKNQASNERRRSHRKPKAVTTAAATATHGLVQPKASERRTSYRKFIVVFAVLLVLLGGLSAVGVIYLIPLLQGPCGFSGSPSEYQILLCQRYRDNAECAFDVRGCTAACVLGFEQDDYECPISCNCAIKGTLESDIEFNQINIQSVLTSYISEEDSIIQELTGSVSMHQMIWDGYTVNGRTRIPYSLSETLLDNSAALDGIRSAIHQLSSATCVDFVARTVESDFIEFVGNRKGCKSSVGRLGGRQEIWISSGCENTGNILHEIMHALGFWHEQARPDRESHVTILYDNIDTENHVNFKKLGSNVAQGLNSPYDVLSIMHMDGYSFSNNGEATIVNVKSGEPVVIQRSALSREDIAEINQLYKCAITEDMTAHRESDQWSQWGEWQPCSASCGTGQSARVRECLDINSTVVFSVRCGSEDNYETKSCSVDPCTDGLWGDWSGCSVTCGMGTRHRSSCCYPNVQHETETCELPTCPPEVTSWTEWSPWGMCSHSCGTGWRRRQRQCVDVTWNIVAPKYCSAQPVGPVEIGNCATVQCNNTAPPVWNEWSQWTECSRTCGGAVSMRHRTCPPGGLCSGVRSEMASCTLDPCPARNKTHIEVASWGPWSGWSLCTKTCGQGTVNRKRFCFGQNYEVVPECLGSDTQSEIDNQLGACFKQPCQTGPDAPPSDGESGLFDVFSDEDESPRWSLWTEWGDCSQTCGEGYTERSRICLDGNIGEEGCIGNSTEKIECGGLTPCSNISMWANWQDWSSCSEICNGTRTRYRVCFNGPLITDLCEGEGQQTAVCNERGCPGYVEMSTTTSMQPTSVLPETTVISSNLLPEVYLDCDGGWIGVLDVNGDNLADVACITNFDTLVLLSNQGNNSLLPTENIIVSFCPSFNGSLVVGDFNGDGFDDILCFNRLAKSSRITFSRQGSFGGVEQHNWSSGEFCTNSTSYIKSENMNADNKSDLVCVEQSGRTQVLLNTWS